MFGGGVGVVGELKGTARTSVERNIFSPESPSIIFAFQLGRSFMKRKKGDLPGRFVPAHIRKAPNRPNEYINVCSYQEQIDPPPSEYEREAPQGEFDLIVNPNPDQKSSKLEPAASVP